jgi:hypothetical protein
MLKPEGAMGEVYVTIGLDKHGDVVDVRLKGGAALAPVNGQRRRLETGSGAPEGEKVLLLTSRTKNADHSGIRTETAADGETGLAAGRCCVVDPATGRIWCWPC